MINRPAIGLLLLFILSLGTGSSQTRPKVIKVADLEQMLARTGTPEIHVINFWATWCGPCVKELPLFEKVTAGKHSNVKVTLVSLDLDIDPDPEKVYHFVERKGLRSEVLILEPADPNVWIDKIEKGWSGAIPATMLVNRQTGERRFIERALKEGELEEYIEELN